MLDPELLEEVKRAHYPTTPASTEEIARFESRAGWALDDDLRAFYSASNGARLFRPANAPYRILALDEIVRTRAAILGPKRDEDRFGPPLWFAIRDIQDGSYVSVDIEERSAQGLYPLRDCFRETFPEECRIIATSFGEFLARALRSEGFSYWL